LARLFLPALLLLVSGLRLLVLRRWIIWWWLGVAEVVVQMAVAAVQVDFLLVQH
jgi:hypothetical protein